MRGLRLHRDVLMAHAPQKRKVDVSPDPKRTLWCIFRASASVLA